MKRHPKEIVEFSFMIKTHKPRRYEIEFEIEPEPIREVRDRTTLKLFKSWWRMATRRGQALYGVLKFADGETWIWQPESDVRHDKYWHGGWQRVFKARKNRVSNAETGTRRAAVKEQIEAFREFERDAWEQYITRETGAEPIYKRYAEGAEPK